MALYKGNKRYAISTNNPLNVIPLEVTRDGVYTAPSGVGGYNPVIMRNNNTLIALGSHTDANGIWHRPEEWDDIESINLGDRHEVYFLCACHKTGTDFFRIRAYGSGMTWSYGHVNNGTYTLHANSTETSVSSGGYISLYLNNIQDNYIVIRLKATSYLTSCGYYDWVADNDLPYAMPYRCQSVLMRYGRMPRATSLARSSTYFLESDNILDFASYYQNTTTAIGMAEAYNSATSLQRWRCDGWDLAKNKITSFAYMFSECYCLSDVPDPLDCSGWVTSSTTTARNIFYNNYSLNTNIKVYNWDLSNITTLVNAFTNCRSTKTIKGIETWTSAPKCTTIASIFQNCYLLMNELDLSSLYLGNGTANFTAIASAFQNCFSCPKIDISNINLSKVTSCSGLFAGVGNCKEIIMNNVTQPTSTCASFNSIFNLTSITEVTIDGWDFSSSTAGNNLAQTLFTYAYGTKKIVFKNCISPSTTINDTTAQFSVRYAYSLEYLDISFLDMSVFSNTVTHAQAFRDAISLIDFYPPKNISKNFNLTNDNQLSHDSLMRIINNLVTVSTTQTLTIGSYNLSKLSAAEQAIATNKGWTLA